MRRSATSRFRFPPMTDTLPAEEFLFPWLDVRSDGERCQHQYKTIHRDAAGEQSSGVPVVVEREGEENRSAADRVHNRKQSAYNQENALGSLNEHASSSAGVPMTMTVSASRNSGVLILDLRGHRSRRTCIFL